MTYNFKWTTFQLSFNADVNELEGITCLSFDSSVASASQGLYVYNQNVQQATTDCKSGNCAFFNSTALSKLELAYFSNAFDQFTGFSVSFFYKRLTSSGSRSLLDNSECSLAASLSVTSNAGSVSSLISNSTQATSTSTETSVSCHHNQLYFLSQIYNYWSFLSYARLFQIISINCNSLIGGWCMASLCPVLWRKHRVHISWQGIGKNWGSWRKDRPG